MFAIQVRGKQSPPLSDSVWSRSLLFQLNMAAQTMLSVGVFPVGVSLAEAQGLGDMPRDMLPAPQLVMLANVAAVAESGGRDSSVADEKEMVELNTVGCSYSDSEDENVIRSVDHFVL